MKHKKEVAIVKAMDKSRISRDGYRYLTAIEPNLPKECAISEQKVFINNLMKQNVKIKIINIKAIAAVDPDEVAHITDKNIVETGPRTSLKQVINHTFSKLTHFLSFSEKWCFWAKVSYDLF